MMNIILPRLSTGLSRPGQEIDLLKLGVKTIITKDYKNLDIFASNLLERITIDVDGEKS